MQDKVASLLQQAEDAIESAPRAVGQLLLTILRKTRPNSLHRARAYEISAELAQMRGDIANAREQIQAAATIYGRHRNKRGLARTLQQEGRLLSLTGYRRSAQAVYDRALSLSQDPLTRARIKVSRSVSLVRTVEPIEAMNDLLAASEVIANEGTVLDRLTATFDTATLLDQMGDPAAIGWLAHVHAEATSRGFQRLQLRVLNLRGTVCARQNQFEDAARFFLAAVDLAEAMDYQHYYILAHSNLIMMYCNAGEPGASAMSVRSLECIAPEVTTPFALSVILKSLGAYYTVPETVDRAVPMLEYALALVPEDDMAKLAVLTPLAGAYALQGDRSSEISARKQLQDGKDRLFNFPTFSHVADLTRRIGLVLDVVLDEAVSQSEARHRAFLQQLVTRAPGLTPMELKICGLLRQQFTTKAIASQLNLSPRTVEDHRFRIRKRFALPNTANLMSYLASM